MTGLLWHYYACDNCGCRWQTLTPSTYCPSCRDSSPMLLISLQEEEPYIESHILLDFWGRRPLS